MSILQQVRDWPRTRPASGAKPADGCSRGIVRVGRGIGYGLLAERRQRCAQLGFRVTSERGELLMKGFRFAASYVYLGVKSLRLLYPCEKAIQIGSA